MWRYTPRATRTTLLQVCSPTTLHIGVQGTFRPEAASGLSLHLRYEVRSDFAKAVRPAVADLTGDDADAPMAVEFDLCGQIQLNYPGTVYLVGGDPQWTYDILSYRWDSDFFKTWHPLTATLQGNSYALPPHHSRMRAAETVVYTLNGTLGELSHVPIPCAGGTLVLQEIGKTIITEWWG